jgi:hypothetical protein
LHVTEYPFFADMAELAHQSAPTVSSCCITPADEIIKEFSGAPVSGLCWSVKPKPNGEGEEDKLEFGFEGVDDDETCLLDKTCGDEEGGGEA